MHGPRPPSPGRFPGYAERSAELSRYLLTLRCADQPGIVRALADGIFEAEGNILESAQFSDPLTGLFCMRTCFESLNAGTDLVREVIAAHIAPFNPLFSLRLEADRRRALLMVSKVDHCLVDLLYRWQMGELLVTIPLIVSNHTGSTAALASSKGGATSAKQTNSRPQSSLKCTGRSPSCSRARPVPMCGAPVEARIPEVLDVFKGDRRNHPGVWGQGPGKVG